jgi:hypothetical protein
MAHNSPAAYLVWSVRPCTAQLTVSVFAIPNPVIDPHDNRPSYHNER